MALARCLWALLKIPVFTNHLKVFARRTRPDRAAHFPQGCVHCMCSQKHASQRWNLQLRTVIHPKQVLGVLLTDLCIEENGSSWIKASHECSNPIAILRSMTSLYVKKDPDLRVKYSSIDGYSQVFYTLLILRVRSATALPNETSAKMK